MTGFTEPFTGSDGASLPVAWTGDGSSGGVWQILSNAAVLASNSSGPSIITRDSNGLAADIILSANILPEVNSYAGLVFRYVDVNNYSVVLFSSSVDRVRFYENVAGVAGNIVDGHTVWAAGTPYTVEIQALGNAITVRLNGAVELTAVGARATTDPAVGLFALGPVAGTNWDNVSASGFAQSGQQGWLKYLIAKGMLRGSPGLGASVKATVTWSAPLTASDGTPITDLANYKVYWGQNDGGPYPNNSGLLDPSITSYSMNLLTSGAWYFVVSALDSQGGESYFGPQATKTI